MMTFISADKLRSKKAWVEVKEELRRLYRKDDEKVQEELDLMEFSMYMPENSKDMRHLHPNLNGEFFVKEILLTMPERVRLFLATKKLESKAELIEAYTEWKEFKRGAYAQRRDKKLHKELEETKKRLAELEKTIETKVNEKPKEKAELKEDSDKKVEKMMVAFANGFFEKNQ